MNETEKRRRQLLEETRRRYGDMRVIPAVHPRYRGIYSELYRDEEAPEKMGGFGIRLMCAVLLFAGFIAIDSGRVTVARVDSKRIVNEIQKCYTEGIINDMLGEERGNNADD